MKPIVRIIVAPGGVVRIESPVLQEKQRADALDFVSKLMPAIQKLNRAAAKA